MTISPEFKNLFEAGRRYLRGESSVQELNGISSELVRWAKVTRAHEGIVLLAEQWRAMANRRWNEFGEQKSPISEAEFCEWLNAQLLNKTTEAQQGDGPNEDSAIAPSS